MSPMIFADSILNNKPIKVYNNGKHKRDFTYIDDIVNGTIKILDKIPKSDDKWSGLKPSFSSSSAPWRIYNIGNNRPVELLEYIKCLEKYLGKKAIKEMVPFQPGDMESTFADVDELKSIISYEPKTNLDEGIKYFCEWYKSYFNY
jgi:UDP-glucuronate 4-epimerase